MKSIIIEIILHTWKFEKFVNFYSTPMINTYTHIRINSFSWKIAPNFYNNCKHLIFSAVLPLFFQTKIISTQTNNDFPPNKRCYLIIRSILYNSFEFRSFFLLFFLYILYLFSFYFVSLNLFEKVFDYKSPQSPNVCVYCKRLRAYIFLMCWLLLFDFYLMFSIQRIVFIWVD